MRKVSPRLWLASLLVVSYGLRVWLACLGGEGFWPDEDRYTDGRNAAHALLHGEWRTAARELLGHPDHTGFRWFSVPPGIMEELTGRHPAAVASYFGLFSVLAIFLIWAVARRTGAGEEEALWAAYFAACANTLFYYSRHFFPYDISLCAMLGALWLGLGPWSWRNSLFVGLAAGFGFLVYNGYWLLGGCVLVLHSLLGDGGRRRFLARAFGSGLGLVASLVPVVALGKLLGYDLIAEDYQWGVIARGDFPFAHRVVAGYLWFGEGGLLLIWLAALGYALAAAWRERRLGRLGWAVGGLGLVAGGLVLLSDVVPLFTVQGRRVRCLVPFLCLAAAFGLQRFLQDRGRTRRGWAVLVGLLALGFAARNFSRPLRQVFPGGFQRLSVQVIERQPAFAAYRLAFGQSLWGLPLDDILPPSAPLLLRPHPLQFRPYQYEGYDTAQRAELNRHDITMRLLPIPADLGQAVRRWEGYPGPVRWSVIFPANRESVSEPLVSSGEEGRGDFLFVRYVDRHHLAFGLDHWGRGAAISPLLEVDYARPHEIVFSLGSLLPPAGSEVYRKSSELLEWRDQALVSLDGRVVFRWREEPWPASPREIMFGVNLIGGSAAQFSFSGQLLKFDRAPEDFVRRAMIGPPVGSLLENSWLSPAPAAAAAAVAANPGLVRRDVLGRSESLAAVRFRLPSAAGATAQPLISFARTDGGLGLLAIRGTAAGLQLGWRDAAGWWWSGPLTMPASGLHTVEAQWSRWEGPPAASRPETARDLAAMIMVDGVIFPHPHPQFFDLGLAQVASWRDPAPAPSDVAAVFSGKMASAPVVAVLPLLRTGALPTRHFRLAATFPANRPGRGEPLLTAGHAGAADGLFVRYERPGWVRIGFDHWGTGGPVSEAVPVVDGAYQMLEVDFGAGSWGSPQGGQVRVTLNGRPVLDAASVFFPAQPEEVTLGKNPVGLSTSDPDFSGRIFPIEDPGPGR